MPRCPSCNKFCGVEVDTSGDAEVEITEAALNEVIVHITGSLPLVSACCSDEIGHLDLDYEVTIPKEDLTAEYD